VVAAVCCGCLDSPPSLTAPVDAAGAFTVASQKVIPLPDQNGPVEDAIEVVPTCTIAAVTVDVNIDHVFRGDIVIRLTSPTVRTVRLKEESDTDDADDVMGNYPLTLTPVDSLDMFEGLPARGTWILAVEDVDAGSTGSLLGWALNLTCG